VRPFAQANDEAILNAHFRRKVRIFVEWTWGMFFPPDITHFRYRRSKEL